MILENVVYELEMKNTILYPCLFLSGDRVFPFTRIPRVWSFGIVEGFVHTCRVSSGVWSEILNRTCDLFTHGTPVEMEA